MGSDMPVQEYPRAPGGELAGFPQDVKITAVLNGYLVRIGCQTIVFTDRSLMLTEIGRYLANPAGMTQEYMEKYTPKTVVQGA